MNNTTTTTKMNNNWRFLTGSLVLTLGVFGFSVMPGCNTTQGVGEDVEELGESIEDAADGE